MSSWVSQRAVCYPESEWCPVVCYRKSCHRRLAYWGGVGVGAAVVVILIGFAIPGALWVFAVVFLVVCPLSMAFGIGGCCCRVGCHDKEDYDRRDDVESPWKIESPLKLTKLSESFRRVLEADDRAEAVANFCERKNKVENLDPETLSRLFSDLEADDARAIAETLSHHLKGLTFDGLSAAANAIPDADTRTRVVHLLTQSLNDKNTADDWRDKILLVDEAPATTSL